MRYRTRATFILLMIGGAFAATYFYSRSPSVNQNPSQSESSLVSPPLPASVPKEATEKAPRQEVDSAETPFKIQTPTPTHQSTEVYSTHRARNPAPAALKRSSEISKAGELAPPLPETSLTSPAVAENPPMGDEVLVPARPLWVTLGAGFSYNSLKQDVAGLSALTVGQLSFPYLMAQLGMWLQKKIAFEVGYQSVPARVLSAGGLNVTQNSYRWQTLSVEALYRLNPSREFREPEWMLRLGLQNHQTPFLMAQNSSDVSLIENNLLMASAGFKYLHPLTEKTRFEWGLRYQTPVAASSAVGSSIRLTSRLSFDGSVGARYSLRPDFAVGTYWSGQYLSYNFNYSDSTSQPIEGQQSLFQSNVSIRLEWEF